MQKSQIMLVLVLLVASTFKVTATTYCSTKSACSSSEYCYDGWSSNYCHTCSDSSYPCNDSNSLDNDCSNCNSGSTPAPTPAPAPTPNTTPTPSSSGTSEFNVQTGSGISYSSVSGSCPQSDECSTACAQGGYTVTVGTDSLKFDPKSVTINGDCTCYSISLLGGTYSGSQFTTTVESSPFTVTTTSTTLTAAYEGCSTYYTIDGTGASSSGFTLTGLLGPTLAIIVALVLA